MTTIHTTVEIPPSRQVNLALSLPEAVPVGAAEMAITVSPVEKVMSRKTLRALAGSWADSKAFDRDGTTLQREIRDEWE